MSYTAQGWGIRYQAEDHVENFMGGVAAGGPGLELRHHDTERTLRSPA